MKLEKAFLDFYWHHFLWRNGSLLLLLVLNSKTAIYIFLVKMTLMLGFLNQHVMHDTVSPRLKSDAFFSTKQEFNFA